MIIYLSPLLGSIISTFIMLIYAITQIGATTESIITVAKMFPTLFLLFSLISYMLSLPLGVFLIKIKEQNFLSDNMFMFYTWITSSTLGLAFSIINFNIERLIGKSILIFICFSLGGVFNSSFYIALKRQIKRVEK